MEERINEREIICVICPNSCRLSVWRDKEGELHVKGNQCPRGLVYGQNEYTNPVRMLITTMRIENAKYPIIPVRSEKPIPKQYLIRAVKAVSELVCAAPIKMGDVVVKNIMGTGINVIASRSMEKLDQESKILSYFDDSDIDDIIHYTLIETVFGGAKVLSPPDLDKLEKAESLLKDRLRKADLSTNLPNK